MIIMYSEQESMVEKVVMVNFNARIRHSTGRIQENHEKSWMTYR